MKEKQKLLADPGISTFYRTALKDSPKELDEICEEIGVKRKRARKWVEKLEEEGLINKQSENGVSKVSVGDENIEELNKFTERLQQDFSEEASKWNERLRKAGNELVRLRDFTDDSNIEDVEEKIESLKDSSDEIDLKALKELSETETFLGYGEIAREELHVFHRKFKVLEKIKGL